MPDNAERKVLEIADKITRQAECLEKYAEDHGHTAKPVASVFHWQATHFRDYADELRAALNAKPQRERVCGMGACTLDQPCGSCRAAILATPQPQEEQGS